MQELERDLAFELGVLPDKHHAKSTLTQLPPELVLAYLEPGRKHRLHDTARFTSER